MSQRDKGFNGGIQAGTTAFDAQSKKLDKLLKECATDVDTRTSDFYSVKRFSNQMKIDLVGDACFGFAPDGHAWFDREDKLFAVFEGKKQNKLGNACERWWDNAVTAKHINPEVKYITFCSGTGAEPGECLDKMRRKAKIMMGEGYEFHMSPDGFTKEQVRKIMLDVLESCR